MKIYQQINKISKIRTKLIMKNKPILIYRNC